jgi:hypothetical protein
MHGIESISSLLDSETPPVCPLYTNLPSADDRAEVLEEGDAEHTVNIILIILAIVCVFCGRENWCYRGVESFERWGCHAMPPGE